MAGVNYVSLMNETIGDLTQLVVAGTVDFTHATLLGFPVDDITIEVAEDGKLQVKNNGISIAKLEGTDFWVRFLSDEADIATLLTRTQFQSTSGVITNFNSSVNPLVNDMYSFGSSSSRWKKLWGTEIDINILIASEISSNLIPSVDSMYTLGTIGKRWGALFGSSASFNGSITATSASFGNTAITNLNLNWLQSSLLPYSSTLTIGTNTYQWLEGYIKTVNALTLNSTNIITAALTASSYSGTSMNLSGTVSCGSITSSGSITNGTNSLLCGAISCGTITSTAINTGTNSISCGSISCSTITSESINTGTSSITSASITAPTITTNTIASTNASLSISNAISMGSNTLSCGSLTCSALTCNGAGTISGPFSVTTGTSSFATSISVPTVICNTISSGGASITMSKQLTLGLNNFTCANASVSSLLSSGTISCGSQSFTCGAAAVTSLTSSGTISCGTQSLTCGSISCGVINTGTNGITTSSISVPTITANTLTSTNASLTVSKALTLGTNTISCGACTIGSLTSSSITASGSISCGTYSLTCGSLTSGSINTGTNGITTTSLTAPTINTTTLFWGGGELNGSSTSTVRVYTDNINARTASLISVHNPVTITSALTTKPVLALYGGDTSEGLGNATALKMYKNGLGGNLTISMNGDRIWEIRQGGGAGAGGFSLIDRTSVAARMEFDDTGQVYFNTTGTYKRTNAAWSTYSDVSIKKNIKSSSIGLQEICALKIREYNLSDDYEHDFPEKEKKKLRRGLIAQEVKSIFPDSVQYAPLVCECCPEKKREILSIDYSDIQIASLRAIQELYEQIEDLRAQVKILQKQ